MIRPLHKQHAGRVTQGPESIRGGNAVGVSQVITAEIDMLPAEWRCLDFHGGELAELAQNRRSRRQIDTLAEKGLHYIFRRGRGRQAVSARRGIPCSTRRIRFGNTIPRRSRSAAWMSHCR
jgi:hypothetical protein